MGLTRAHTVHDGDCHDLNQPPAGSQGDGGLTLAAAVRLRRLYHLDTAAIAAALLTGRPGPQTLAATTIHVAPDAATLHIADRPGVTVPDHAHALLRSRAGQPVLGRRWPRLIAAAYWAVQLDHASHHTGIRMYDPLPII